MIIDVDYGFYRLGETDEGDPQIGTPGTLIVSGSGLLVSAFTQGGPVSVRLLVGDFAPGPNEDSWREEWEYIQDVVVEVPANAADELNGLALSTWEYGPSDPPSGNVVPPGRWCVRFHARGRAKVAGEDAMPQAPLEEHLFLIWPEDATGGVSPAWKEVSGTSVRMPFQIGHLSPSGRVKTPDGCYWLTTVSSSLAQAAAVLSAETPTDLPRRPALTSVSSGLCVTTDPTVRSLEVFVDGSEYTPERYTNASAWNVVAQCELNVERPVRLIDGTGQVPRAFDDPLLPPGRWVFRLDMRDSHFRTPLGDGTTIGEDPMHVHDHRLRVWPAGAHARDSEMEEDEHVWLGRRR